ncbi:MAG: hypothetical protein QF724_04765 [Planctomycetota bacterium]|jgi:hypothetical protein|nr:hypothetical protein [Planctomycetota bacterium]MDP6369714.1 hypothetical protein [Planctomycetota bacterium]MDP6520608.1 hypothetical protein [Planctomycetota bacterium]MDP6838229.1 hypothetical protein [Planctomycetota bacterium]
MEHNQNYYDDRKYCESCNAYVHYLMSIDHSFCVECGSTVRLFSKDDWQAFNEELKQRRPKGGRPRKNGRGKESA